MPTSGSPTAKRRGWTLSELVLAFLYFSRFVLTTVPAHLSLVAVFARRPAVPRRLLIYMMVVAVFVGFSMLLSPAPGVPLRNALFFFSFLTPLILMSSRRDAVARFVVSHRFILLLCAVTIAEAIVVNSWWGANVWFFPANHPHRYLIFGDGWYQRPSGLTGIASSTAFIVVMSLVLGDGGSRQRRLLSFRNLVATFTLLVLATGTGFVLFITYLGLRLLPERRRLTRAHLRTLLALGALVALLLYGATGRLWTSELDKFSFHYVGLIIDNKMEMLVAFRLRPPIEMMVGGQVSASTPVLSTMTDFGYFGLFDAMGAVGTLLVMSAPLLYWRALAQHKRATFFYLLSYVHYPALCSPPGAVLLALYLFQLSATAATVRARPLPAAA